MTEEQRAILDKAKKKITVSNKIRLVFLYITLVLILIVLFGGKLFGTDIWYVNLRSFCYASSGVTIIAMLLATFAKLFFTIQYNTIVKSIKN